MKINYIVNARIPTEKAHGIHIMKMCEAFADTHELNLVLPNRLNKIKDDPFSYYGVKSIFKIKKLPCLDLIPYLGHLGLWIESTTFTFFVFWYALFKKADVIYTRDKFLLPLVLFKKNLVFEAHAFPQNFFLYGLFLKKITKIIVITHQLKTLFVEQGIMPDKILVAPDGVDLEKFNISETQAACRTGLNLDQEKKIVLYTGHLYDWKGAQILAQASQFLAENVAVYFVGGTKEDVEKFSAYGGSASGGKIHIVGHRPYDEIPYWLKAADVLVLPNSAKENISRYWTSPLKMFEYMAAKKPIVASDLPSIREILNENSAVLVSPDDPVALSEGIRGILQNEKLSDKISASAFCDVQEYTWAKRAKNICQKLF